MAVREEPRLAGFEGERRATLPIADPVGGVPRFGGVSEEYERTAAHCMQVGE